MTKTARDFLLEQVQRQVDDNAKWKTKGGLRTRLIAMTIRARADEAERSALVFKKSLKVRASELRLLADEIEAGR